MSEYRNSTIEPNKQNELLEPKKQLLGFDEVNYEQRREPYQDTHIAKVNITHLNTPNHPENRNNR